MARFALRPPSGESESHSAEALPQASDRPCPSLLGLFLPGFSWSLWASPPAGPTPLVPPRGARLTAGSPQSCTLTLTAPIG